MTKLLRTSLTALTLAAGLLAHGGAEHITGTVKAIAAEAVTVENVKHEVVVIGYTAKTKVLRGKTPGAWKDIKVGDRVVVHAEKNKVGVYEAEEVDLPAAAAKAAH